MIGRCALDHALENQMECDWTHRIRTSRKDGGSPMTDFKKSYVCAGFCAILGFATGVNAQTQATTGRTGLGGLLRRGNAAQSQATAKPPATGTAPGGRVSAAPTIDPAVKPATGNGSSSMKPGLQNAPKDSGAIKTNGVLPALTPVDELTRSTIVLPTEPVEPYLLTKEAGPFMVLAHTFRGPDSVRYAQALAMELRSAHQLRAYIYFKKIKPMNSNVRGVPPTATAADGDGRISEPEIYRIYDEAAVLIGDAPTMKEAEDLLKVVKKVKPVTLDSVPSLFPWRAGAGLKKAIVTANPLVPAQQLFAREADPMVDRMNRGPHSIYNAPGPYTLVVARFIGRSTFDQNDKEFFDDSKLKSSPLAKATDDAELMAAELNKDPQLKQAGYSAYVYHDRKKSVVTLGNFNAKVEPNQIMKDQKVQSIRQHLDKLNQKYLSSGKFETPLSPTDMMDVPKRAVQQKATTGLFQ